MCATASWRVLAVGIGLALLAGAAPATAQYAEEPRTLLAVDGFVNSAAQIGRRLFVGGFFAHATTPTGGAVVVDVAGAHVPGGFPRFDGTVHAIVADGLGGWVVVGAFTHVAGQPHAGFARVRPDRTVDPLYRLVADGPIRRVAIAHGRIYLVGDFTTINGSRRRGLAALDALTGRLSSFAAGFDPGGRALAALSVSSIGVYVSGWIGGDAGGRLWGLDAAMGSQLFERTGFVNAIAATSARVYVGGFGYQRPVWAVDPLTGLDVPWSIGLTFQYLGGTYGDYTSIGALMLDGGRLYLGGYFRTSDGRFSLAAVDAASGHPSSWRAEGAPAQITGVGRVGPAVVAMARSGSSGVFGPIRHAWAYDVGTGAPQLWDPQVYGSIGAIAPAPEGAVVGGDFNGIDGVARPSLASLDLDSGTLEPWVTTVPGSQFIERVDTDETFLFVLARSGTFYKLDPLTGAVLATVELGPDASLIRCRIVDGRIFVAVLHTSGLAEVVAVTIADWSRQVLPVTLGGPLGNYVSDLEVMGDTLYVAGPFTTVNGVMRPYLAAVDIATGTVLPFAPSPESVVNSVRRWGSRLLAAGPFRRIGGERRRGLAELDALTGRALDWNPDVPGGAQMAVGPNEVLYVQPNGNFGGRALRDSLLAVSPLTLKPMPWRPSFGGFVLMDRLSFTPDCLATWAAGVECRPPALPSPTMVRAQQAGSQVTLEWDLPAGAPTWTAVQVEVGSREGGRDVGPFDLAAGATSISSPAPPGSYFARVRTTGPSSSSLPTPDVSFAVGGTAAPLDASVVTDGTALRFEWQPPSTGTPAAYLIEAGTSQGRADVAQLPVGGAATGFAIDAPPGRYWGRIRSIGPAGTSVPSGELIIDVDATDSPCYATPPLAPQGLTTAVDGNTVTLSWVQPDAGPVPNTQRLVVGSAPGLDDLGAIGVPGPSTSFTTPAPRGTYYVRVFALNTCGASPFSNEVQVVVP